MIRTLALNPFIGVQIAAILQIPFLIALIFTQVPYFRKETPLSHHIPIIVVRLVKGLLAGVLIVISLILFDIAFFWILGAWTYADWRFQLPSVILMILVGINFLGWIIFRKFNKLELLYVVAVSIVLGVFLHIIVPSIVLMSLILEEWLIWVLLLLIVGYIPVYLIKTSKNPLKNIELNISKVFLFSPKFNLVLWILATAQSMLTLSGYSLFG